MATKKLTKDEKAQRELQLVDVTFNGLTTHDEGHARAWALRAHELQQGLSKKAIARAQKLAHQRADSSPPGYVTAMECFAIFDNICEDNNISKADAETLWGAVAKACMHEIASRRGEFFEAAREFGLLADDSDRRTTPLPIQVITAPAPQRGCGNPNCRNCRPRAAEELN